MESNGSVECPYNAETVGFLLVVKKNDDVISISYLKYILKNPYAWVDQINHFRICVPPSLSMKKRRNASICSLIAVSDRVDHVYDFQEGII